MTLSVAADPGWLESGWGYRASGVDELSRAVSRIGTLETGRRFVWRGVPDWRWRVQSSLYRNLVAEVGSAPDESAMRAREMRLLALARGWRLDMSPSGLLPDLHLLALMQHHGLPTRLLDVTSNPFTALWFGCQRRPGSVSDSSGVLFAFDVTDVPEIATIDIPGGLIWAAPSAGPGLGLERALQDSTAEERPFLVRPSVADHRMQAQEGLFLTSSCPETSPVRGVDGLFLQTGAAPSVSAWETLFSSTNRKRGRPAQVKFVAIVIPPNVKRRMRPHLEGTYNKSARLLFPDLAGLRDALANGNASLA